MKSKQRRNSPKPLDISHLSDEQLTRLAGAGVMGRDMRDLTDDQLAIAIEVLEFEVRPIKIVDDDDESKRTGLFIFYGPRGGEKDSYGCRTWGESGERPSPRLEKVIRAQHPLMPSDYFD